MIIPFLFNIRNKVLPLYKLTNEQLMERVCANDDDKAFDELYHRHARRVMGFFYRQMNHDEERASDLMQDTFMRAWTNRQRWKAEKEFLPWLFTIAFNISKNEYRHNGYKTDYEQHVLNTQDEDYADDAELEIDAEIFDKALQSVLDTMPPEMRTLFSLRFEEELTIPQISDIMGIPQGTVKSRLHSLTRILKEKLKQYGNI
ncbi:MAG: sigma-70 family RNA polymerase sigma factor [Prevotellaceae bacterium]|nr:sigma-70 family RNA polymerase sigma factor [Candidatus Minthosoma caballi]